MSQRDGNSKLKTLDNIVHGFVESVAHEHDHQIDLLKASPSFAAGTVTELTQHPESSSVIGQKGLQAQQLTSLKENQLREETTDTFKFSDFSFLPQRSTLTETVKTLMIDSYELSNDTLSVVRVPPKSKRLFSAALIVANAVNTSVNSLTSDSISKDSLSTNDTKSLAIPAGFKETVIVSSPASNLKKEKKSRGTSRLNAVLKETSTESILENQLEMLQKRFGRVRNRLASKGMHKCRESHSGCSVDDVIYDKCYKPQGTQIMELANVPEGNEVGLSTTQPYSERAHKINSQRVIECHGEDDSDIDEEVIHNEIFQHWPYDDHTVLARFECEKNDLINIPKKKIKKKKNQVVPISFSFRKKMHSKLEAKIEKQYRIMKEYLKVATLSSPSVDVVLYCRWNPKMIESCGHTTELIIYTMKAFFMTNSGLHVNWIHCPEEKFERLIERGAQMKFRKDFPESVLGVLTLSYNASVLLKNPQSNLLSALCELLEIHRDELVVVEVNVK